MGKAEVFYENKGKKYNCRINGVPYFRKSKVINGKIRTFYGDGEKDCLAKIAEAENQEALGFNYDYKNSKIGQVFEYWLMNVKRVDKNLKASSFARYETSFRLHVKPYQICQTTLSKLTSAGLQQYINMLSEDEGLSGATIKECVKVWKMFLAWAVEEGYLIKNPTKNIVLPGKRDKGKKKFDTFNADECRRILDQMNKEGYWYAAAIVLAFETGMRRGEILGLQWKDIKDGGIYVSRSTTITSHVEKDGSHNTYREIWDTKTVNSERFIPVKKELLDYLAEYKKERMDYYRAQGLGLPVYMITTKTGQLVDPSSFLKSYGRLLERAGVKYRKFHAIRHTFATEALRQGMNVKDLQMLMGHSDIETTLGYVHSDETSKRSAMEKMDSLIGIM